MKRGHWGYLRPAEAGESGDYVIEVADLLPELPKPSAPGQVTVNATIKVGPLVTDEMVERGAKALLALYRARLRASDMTIEPWEELPKGSRVALFEESRACLEAALCVSGDGKDAS